jgi:hypothetical protein
MRWAIIYPDTFIVENIVIWGGEGDIFANFITVQLGDDEYCNPGWIYDPNATPRFIGPSTPEN